VRIAIIGKFPPIQGGVSMRTYWTAHRLAARGHDVHVITNAKEAEKPYRMCMRPEDWDLCEARYGSGGGVSVHWTDPADWSQHYTPMASPFVSKLAATGARLHADHPFDVIHSHYLEPYGVAAHLLAGITGAPHVARMAGSDAGRLWHHPQFETLYDHILRAAYYVVATGTVAERALARGVAPDHIVSGGGFALPEELFSRSGPPFDPLSVRDEIGADLRSLIWGEFSGTRPYFGVYGKLGESKGSFALLAALERLKRLGLDVGLVALAHGHRDVERRFRSEARRRGLSDRVLQLPFMPHWRMPDFLRGCVAVLCLEQDFPIAFHQPIVAREVLLAGACLVASVELVCKLPAYGRLPHGHGCIAIRDVNNIDELSSRLAMIARRPGLASLVGARGRAFALELQRDAAFPETIERVLLAAARHERPVPSLSAAAVAAPPEPFALSQIAADAIAMDETVGSADAARATLVAVERRIAEGDSRLERLVPAMEIEISLAAAESAADAQASNAIDPIFRLRPRGWAMSAGELGRLRPVRDPAMRLVEFDHDVRPYLAARTMANLPPVRKGGRSHVVVFGATACDRRPPLLVDPMTARLLELSDGTRTAAEIIAELWPRDFAADKLAWLETLFLHGMIGLVRGAHSAGVSTQFAPLMGGVGSGPAGTPARRKPSRRRKRSQSLS